jgi:hypothetical protein
MSSYKPELTASQKAIVIALVKQEARLIGYGTRYYEFNQREWPIRIRQLRLDKPELTASQKAIVIALVKQEARLIGYGTLYHEFNQREWPIRIRQLRLILAKLEDRDVPDE